MVLVMYPVVYVVLVMYLVVYVVLVMYLVVQWSPTRRSRYRNTPPAPYKGMQLKRRVHNRQTPQATRKQLQTD